MKQEIVDYKEALELALRTIHREEAKTTAICEALQKIARLDFFTDLAAEDIAAPDQAESSGADGI